MTIRNLPQLQARGQADALSFTPDDDSLAKWNPAIHAADATGDNVIAVDDVIGEDLWTGGGITARGVTAALRRIGARDVVVNVNSPGGDFFEGIAIYNLLREHPHKVTVQIMGLAASAASVIAMAGDDILISEVGFMMVHNSWGLAIGNRHDLRAAADVMEPFDDAMAKLYAARAEVDRAVAAAWMDKETWFNGDGAIEAGLADGLLSYTDIVEAATPDTKARAAIRRVDLALAKQGLPRSERRSLLGDLKRGTQDAAASATQDAGDEDLAAGLRSLINIYRPQED